MPALGSHKGEPSRSRNTRTTVGGRVLHYVLTVMQEPDRARACGSGPKCNSHLVLGPKQTRLTSYSIGGSSPY